MVENFAISKNELVLCCFSIIDTWMNPDLCSTVRKYNCTCIIVDLALQAGLCVKGQQVIQSQPDLPSSGFPAMNNNWSSKLSFPVSSDYTLCKQYLRRQRLFAKYPYNGYISDRC